MPNIVTSRTTVRSAIALTDMARGPITTHHCVLAVFTTLASCLRFPLDLFHLEITADTALAVIVVGREAGVGCDIEGGHYCESPRLTLIERQAMCRWCGVLP